MSPLDIALLVCALISVPLAWYTTPARSALCRTVLALACALGVAQLIVEGAYWRFSAAYALLAIAALLRARRTPRTRWSRVGVTATTGAVVIVLVASWITVPVPEMPEPTGPYNVGTIVYRWTLPDRDEPVTPRTDDRRNIIVQAWYPAATGATGAHSAYIDGLGRLPARFAGVPSAIFANYDRIDTHAIASAAVAASAAQWPVVVFSHGYGATRSGYSALLADLASRGVIVVAVDHPYEAALTQLVDGSLVTQVEQFIPGAPDRIGYMIQQNARRVADLRSVLDAITTGTEFGPLAAHMDRARITLAGHSFGGAASVATAQADARVAAAINIDGTLYGDVPDTPLAQPFLLIQSDHAETKHGSRFIDGHARLFAHLGGRGQRLELPHTNHYSFTDASLIFSPPWRWAMSLVFGGSFGTAATVRATNDRVMAFIGQLPGKGAAH